MSYIDDIIARTHEIKKSLHQGSPGKLTATISPATGGGFMFAIQAENLNSDRLMLVYDVDPFGFAKTQEKAAIKARKRMEKIQKTIDHMRVPHIQI